MESTTKDSIFLPKRKYKAPLTQTHPEVAAQWSPRNTIKPEEITRGADKKVWWICEKGHEWEALIYNRTGSRKSGCPYCSGHRVLKGINDLSTAHPELVKQWSDKNIGTPENTFKNARTKAIWVCDNGHEWSASVNDRSDGHGCPLCTHKISEPEHEIASFIRSLGVTNIVKNARNIIPPKELDIYLPEYNLAVEYNGLYWHSERFLKDKNTHLAKYLACKEKGITLIQVWEDDWLYKEEIVKKLIRHKLGRQNNNTVYARKTNIKAIERDEAVRFFNENHILGAASGTYYLGLKYGTTTVAAMILTRRGDTLTLDRYATSCNVPGGHSKLVAWVERNIDYKYLATFADLCLSEGNLYTTTGWTKDVILKPDYMYVVGLSRVHKFNYRLKRFRNDPDLLWKEGLTERQLAELNGLLRIWDCGKIRYIKERPT